VGTVKSDENVDVKVVFDHTDGMPMDSYLTTAELARALGLSDSTIRHYRAAGRITPRRQTPGGHARYDLGEVVAILGVLPVDDEPQSAGLTRETFAPLGVHDVRRSGSSGPLAAEIVALGVRDAPEPTGSRRRRWGGTLLNARVPVSR
jgi:hypothetical protein